MNEQRTEKQQEAPTGPPEEAPLAIPKVDLNTASADELAQLPGIGPKMAKRIVEYRETVRSFEEPEELMAVPGIARETYRRLADRLTVSPAAQPPVEEVKPRPTIEEVEERIHTMKTEIEAVSTALRSPWSKKNESRQKSHHQENHHLPAKCHPKRGPRRPRHHLPPPPGAGVSPGWQPPPSSGRLWVPSWPCWSSVGSTAPWISTRGRL
jgi:competence ComEA-like helix-hairpin-helix protein